MTAMLQKITRLVLVFLLFGTCFLHAQAPFESIFENTRNSPYNYWYGYNQSQVLPLDDGGYILKDYLSPPTQDSFNLYSTARITRFNGCHNKVWSKAIDSTINGSLNFVLRYQYPDSSIHKYPRPYPPTYLSVMSYGNGGYGYNIYNGYSSFYYYSHYGYYNYYGYGNQGHNNSIISTTDHNLITCDLMGNGHYNALPIVTKLDPNGKIVWTKKLNMPGPNGKIPIYNNLSCIAGSNGSCFVVFTGFNASIYDTYPIPYISITKMDRNGKVVNANRLSGFVYNSIFDEDIENLLKMPDGGFVIHVRGGFGSFEFIKLDSNGNFIWAKYGGWNNLNGNFQGSSVSFGRTAVDSKGNIYNLESVGDGGFYALSQQVRDYIEKIDSSGNPLWLEYINDSISKSRYCNIESIGIGKDNQLAAILTCEYNGSYPNTHSFYVKFDTIGKFNFARLLRNSTNRNYNDYYYNGVSMQPTADSGYLSLNNYYDTIYNTYNSTSNYYSFLTKLDKNGKGSCIGKDTTITFYNSTFVMQNLPAIINTGFAAYDTSIVIKTSNFKEKMLCAPGLFPIADLGGDSLICTAKADTLYAGNENLGAKFLWSTGDTTPKISVTKNGTYWISMTYGYCTSTDTAKILFKSQINTGLPKNEDICSYDSVMLKVHDSLTADYYWITPKKTIVNGYKVMAKDSGYYYLMLKGTVTCPSLDRVHIGYYALPPASAGPDTVLCYDQTYTMQGAGGITYQWIPATYLSSATDPHALATLPNTEQYILIVSNKQGCHDTSRVLLKVRPKLQVKASANNAEVCYGQPVVLKAVAHGGDSLHYQFKWVNDNVIGDSVMVNIYQSGWHTVVLSDHCSASSAIDSVYVSVIPPAKAAFTYVPATKIKANHSLSFDNKSQNASSYLWTFGTRDSSKLTSPVYIYTDTGEYRVMLVAYGLSHCPNDTAYSFIKIITDQVTIYIPNAFTPNGDGANEYFDISGTGIASYSYDIYNRWGEHIFHAATNQFPPLGGQGAGAAWDGTFRNVPVQDGVYIYMLDVLDTEGNHHYLSGNVTIMR